MFFQKSGNICVFLIQGREIYPSSDPSYREAEAKNTTLVNRMLKMFVFAETCLFVPTILLPICYAIFNAPGPQSWVLPLDTKYINESTVISIFSTISYSHLKTLSSEFFSMPKHLLDFT